MNNKIIRQIALDTETTGMNHIGLHYKNHKIIEIGAVEILNRCLTGNNFHVYLNPNRSIDSEALNIHGITNEFLADKPTFDQIADKFYKYINGAELIIHNASFDVGFIDYEFNILNRNFPKIDTFCKITDTLVIGRNKFPGKRNSLDALCLRYSIDNSKRKLHNALLDAQILAYLYLAMTRGQTSIVFNEDNIKQQSKFNNYKINKRSNKFCVILANSEEINAHNINLSKIKNKSGFCLWNK